MVHPISGKGRKIYMTYVCLIWGKPRLCASTIHDQACLCLDASVVPAVENMVLVHWFALASGIWCVSILRPKPHLNAGVNNGLNITVTAPDLLASTSSSTWGILVTYN